MANGITLYIHVHNTDCKRYLLTRPYLGGYQGIPWKKDVECFWAFDEQDKLIDIFVEKQADAL
jgi:hypothetical protein